MMKIEFLRCAGAPYRSARGRVHRILLGSALALTVGLALAACATSHARRGSTEAVIHLTNDLIPPSDVSIYAVSEDGFRQLLGDVPPNGRKVLHLPMTGVSQMIRLVAERPLGRVLRSDPFVLTSHHPVIDWDLQSNSIWFPSDGQE